MVKATAQHKKNREKLKITAHKSQKSNFFCPLVFRWLMNDVLMEFL
jgi:hypothetical protein